MPVVDHTKKCKRCGIEKNTGGFHRCYDGFRATCKECRKEDTRAKERKNVRRRQRYAEDPSYRAYRLRESKESKRTEAGRRGRIRGAAKHRARYPDKAKARDVVGNAVKLGKLKPAKCFKCAYCDVVAVQWHHHNGYSVEAQLDVVPVCLTCHVKADAA